MSIGVWMQHATAAEGISQTLPRAFKPWQPLLLCQLLLCEVQPTSAARKKAIQRFKVKSQTYSPRVPDDIRHDDSKNPDVCQNRIATVRSAAKKRPNQVKH